MKCTYYTKEDKFETDDDTKLPYKSLHREDGPAVITKNTKKWYLNGLKHRTDGPAKIYNRNEYIREKWYINDVDKTEEITMWIKDNNIPEWSTWDTNMKIRFKLIWN